MHREELVVRLGGQKVLVRRAELPADHQGLGTAEHQEEERREEVEIPDLLVVRGPEPGTPAFTDCIVGVSGERGRGSGGH